MPSNHLILCCPLLLLPSIFPSIRVFSVSQFFTSGGQRIGVAASTSVLSMNTQDSSSLGGLVGSPCSPRDSQESSPTPQFKSINSSVLSFLYSPTLTSIHEHWKNHSPGVTKGFIQGHPQSQFLLLWLSHQASVCQILPSLTRSSSKELLSQLLARAGDTVVMEAYAC